MSDLFTKLAAEGREKRLAEEREKTIHFYGISVDHKSLISLSKQADVYNPFSDTPPEKINSKINLLMPRKESGLLNSVAVNNFRMYQDRGNKGRNTRLNIHTFSQYVVLIEEDRGNIIDISIIDIEKLNKNKTENILDEYLTPKKYLGKHYTEYTGKQTTQTHLGHINLNIRELESSIYSWDHFDSRIQEQEIGILSKLEFNNPYWTCPFSILHDFLIDLFDYGEIGFLKLHDLIDEINFDNRFYRERILEIELNPCNYDAIYLLPKIVDIVYKKVNELILLLREKALKPTFDDYKNDNPLLPNWYKKELKKREEGIIECKQSLQFQINRLKKRSMISTSYDDSWTYWFNEAEGQWYFGEHPECNIPDY